MTGAAARVVGSPAMIRTSLAVALTLLAACGSSSKPAASPGPAPAAVTADCASYEHQVELCQATCADCAGEAPGNSCNVCAEGCASQLWCAQCGAADHCQ